MYMCQVVGAYLLASVLWFNDYNFCLHISGFMVQFFRGSSVSAMFLQCGCSDMKWYMKARDRR